MPNMMPRAEKRAPGASLPTVIMVVALMMTMAFTVVAIAFNHLNLSFRTNNNGRAEELAEATLALAIEKARQDIEHFGISGDAADKTVTVTLDSLPAGSKGVLTFDPDQATALGVPFSTNNRSESNVQGSNPRQAVPGQSLHLVARAEVSGAFSTMEAIVSIPKFPYSIASGGAIRSNGGLLVAAVRPEVTVDLSSPIHKDDLQPGHLVTNSSDEEQALVLSGTNEIMGDVQSHSGATIGQDTKVYGETRLHADAVKLPNLDATDYDPLGASPQGADSPINPADVQTVNSGAGSLTVKGYNVFGEELADGSYNPSAILTVDNGIHLNGGVLYVNGDLNVTSGGVSGKGAIVATGKITINGGGEASTDNQAALVANGDITLQGTASEKAKFAGLIYTKGNLKSENLRLAGVFVAAGDSSEVTLENTELYQVDSNAKIELSNEPTYTIPNVIPNSLGIGGHTIPAAYDFSALSANINNYANPNSGGGEPDFLFKFKVGNAYKRFTNGPTGPVMVDTSGPDQYVLDGADLGLTLFGEPVADSSEAVNVVISHFEQIYASEGKALTTTDRTNLTNQANSLFEAMQTGYNFSREAAQQAFDNGGGNATGDPGGGEFKWSLDLSEFFGESKPMQVRCWGRYR